MLERRWFPTAGVFKSAKLVLAGSSTVNWAVGELGNHGARSRLPVAAELPVEANTRSPRQTARGICAEDVSAPSPIHRAARIFRGHPAIGYVVAFASVGLATAFQWLAHDLYDGTPFLLIYPAIVVTAFVGGYRAGLLSALFAGLSQWYLFIPVFNWLAVMSYAFDATLCVLLIEYINRTLEKETEAKQHQTLLKNELHHRINNLFAVIQSVIRFSLPNNAAPVSPALFKDRLLVRLQAMLDANQYVSDSKGEVALLDLVQGQIRGLDSQVRVHGRPHLMLSPQLTQNFSPHFVRTRNKLPEIRSPISCSWSRSYRIAGKPGRCGLRLDGTTRSDG